MMPLNGQTDSRQRAILGPDGQPIRSPRPLQGPNGEAIDTEGFALPHVLTFSSLFNSAARLYSWRWDEAYKHSQENALSMRRDCFLMGLLRERQLATAQLNWHLEPENKRDTRQKAAAEDLTRIVKRIPHLQRLLMSCLEAVWYGRYGVQKAQGYRQHSGRRVLTVVDHRPVNGDKIQYRYRFREDGPEVEDGTPCILVHASQASQLPEAELVYGDRGRALLLKRGYWRERFIIHQHEVDDADFFEGEMSGAVHGVGIRSRIYWMDWLRKEYLSWIADYIERVGMGVLIFYYEHGNKESKDAATEAANEQSRNAVIVWPRPIGKEKMGAGVERLEVPMGGSDLLLKLQSHIEDIIERYIVGQSGSSSSETSGMGTHDTDFQQDTKYRLTKFDAANLQETLTTDLLDPLRRWNLPGADYPVDWVFDVDRPNAKDQLDGAKSLFDMGAELDADEVRSFAGLSKPEAGAEVLKKPDPPAGGMPGMPGEPSPEGPAPAPIPRPQPKPQPAQPAGGGSGWQPYRGPRGGTWEKNAAGDTRHAQAHGREDDPERYADDWNEIEHPRGEGGEFSAKGGGKGKGKAAKAPAASLFDVPTSKAEISGGDVHTARQQLKAGRLRVEKAAAPVRSDATGKPIRHVVTLANGAKLHPDELARMRTDKEGNVYLAHDEGLTVIDPASGGRSQAKDFGRALHGVSAYTGRPNDDVTVQSAHGYAVTMPRAKWVEAAKGADPHGTFSEWYDARGEGATETKDEEPSAPTVTDQELFKRPGEGFGNLQKALGLKKPAMGPRGGEQVRKALSNHPGGKVIAALLNMDGLETGYDRNGFALRGGDAYTAALDGRFSPEELEAASKWLYATFNNSTELANVNQHRWIRDSVRTAKPKAEDSARESSYATAPGFFGGGSSQSHLFGRQGEPRRYEKTGGKWITIGGSLGEDGKRHGGSPVYVEGGRITKGHPSLTGKKIDAIQEDEKPYSHEHADDLVKAVNNYTTDTFKKKLDKAENTHLSHALESITENADWGFSPEQQSKLKGVTQAIHWGLSTGRVTGTQAIKWRDSTPEEKLRTVAYVTHIAKGGAQRDYFEAFQKALEEGTPKPETKGQRGARTRAENASSAGHARAVWGKKAKQDGLNPQHLHSLAGEILSHDRAFKSEHTAMLQQARRALSEFGGDWKTLKQRADKGQLEGSDQVKGIDEVAEDLAANYPSYFDERTMNNSDRLFGLLAEGNPEPMLEEEAYDQAFNHLMEAKAVPAEDWSGRADEFRVRDGEEVPFSRREDPDRYARNATNARVLAAVLGGHAAGDHLVLPTGEGRCRRLRVVTLEAGAGDQVEVPEGAAALVVDDRAEASGDLFYRAEGGVFQLADAVPVKDPGELLGLLGLLGQEQQPPSPQMHARQPEPMRERVVKRIERDAQGLITRVVEERLVGHGREEEPDQYAHAPKGGVTIQGKKYKGGEFIPGDVLAQATPEEKAKVKQGGLFDEAEADEARPPKPKAKGKALSATVKAVTPEKKTVAQLHAEQEAERAAKQAHPLAGKSPADITAQLTREADPRAPSANPRGYKLADFHPATADEQALSSDVVNAVTRQRQDNPFARLTIPELYDRLRQKHPRLTVQEFQEQLAKMHRAKQVDLGPYTQSMATMERPEMAVPLDREAKYYVGPGTAPTPLEKQDNSVSRPVDNPPVAGDNKGVGETPKTPATGAKPMDAERIASEVKAKLDETSGMNLYNTGVHVGKYLATLGPEERTAAATHLEEAEPSVAKQVQKDQPQRWVGPQAEYPKPVEPAPAEQSPSSSATSVAKKVSRASAANHIADALADAGYKASVWTGGNAVRVYVSDKKGKIGYVGITHEGTVEPSLDRQKGAIMGHVPALEIESLKPEDKVRGPRLPSEPPDDPMERMEWERIRELGRTGELPGA